MISFKTHLSEEKTPGAISHLKHFEEGALENSKSAMTSIDRLQNLDKHLQGKRSTVKSIGIKADGSPSFQAGYTVDPVDGQRKFGVAYKGAAKGYAFSKSDVNKLFGHAPALASKIGQILDHGPKVWPDEGIYQGDFMGSKRDETITKSKGHIHQKENTITYTSPANSKEGKKLDNAKISLAIHTRIDKSEPEYNVDTSNFREHPDVHMFNMKLPRDSITYTPEAQERVSKHLNAAMKAHGSIADHDELVNNHTEDLKTYINSTVRNDKDLSTDDYANFVRDKYVGQRDKLKTDIAKNRKTEEMNSRLNHIDTNKKDFDSLMSMHDHLEKAKNVMVKAINGAKQNYEHSINGSPSDPEGSAINFKDGQPDSLVKGVVRRKADGGFSAANFAARPR